jgi:RimJ/RimL family protein N-acetyltransferase
MATPTLRTTRLVLREWRDEDCEPFAAMNADPRVAEFLGGPIDRAASDAMVDRIRAHFRERGFGAWAVEVAGGAHFAGFLGLAVPRFEAPFTPCVEIGWRLAAEHWGQGYATEAGRAALAFGFEELRLAEIVSFAVPANLRSLRVMERLGLVRDEAGDFDHPLLPKTHPLSRHVLYRIRRGAGR